MPGAHGAIKKRKVNIDVVYVFSNCGTDGIEGVAGSSHSVRPGPAWPSLGGVIPELHPEVLSDPTV